MAHPIATATGIDRGREKQEHRLGSQAARAEASTWRTFATAFVRADGSGYVQVRRDDETLHYYGFAAETPELS